MPTIDLSARQRTVLGKKVKVLRRNGIVPANIYGHNVESTPIEVPVVELRRVLRVAGHTGLVRIVLDGQAGARTVVVRQVQRQFTTGNYVHVDFQEISMTETMTLRIPVTLTGHAPASDDGAVIVQVLDSVEVECLPGDIPGHLDADVSSLRGSASAVHVRDLLAPANVTILTPGDQMIAMVSAASSEEEGAETAVEAEGEAPAEEAAASEA